MLKKLPFALLLACLLARPVLGQQRPRPDRSDQRTVRLRIDLRLAENRQLAGTNAIHLPQLIVQHFTEGHYEGRWPWELGQPMPLVEFREFMDRRQAAWPASDDRMPLPCRCAAPAQQPEVIPIGAEHDDLDYELAPVIDLIEDHWFDRTLGRERVKTLFVVLYYQAENGLEHPAVAFRYTDVRNHTLARCRWLSSLQEPANLTLEQVVDLRLFRGVILDESGREPRTLDEAERLRLRRIEAESARYQH